MKPDTNWVVYLVRCSDKSLYCGITNDLKRRLEAHNIGKGAKYTRSRTPVELFGTSSEMTKSAALKLEYRIKKTPANRKQTELENGKAYTKMENTQVLQQIQKELHSVAKSIQQITNNVGNIVTAFEKLSQADSSKGTKAKRAPNRKKVVEKIKRLTAVLVVFTVAMLWCMFPSPSKAAQDGGYDVTSELWIKAILQVPGAPVTLVWKKVGTDITPSGAQVVSGYFYADPDDFVYGSIYNPEVFVKVYIAPNGWANIALNHVTVDNVDVYSSLNYNGTPDQSETITLSSRLTEHQYNGVNIDSNLIETNSSSGTTAFLSGNDGGSLINSGLWAKAILQPATGPVTLIWKKIGSDTTITGDRVVSGYFYADPNDFAYGSEYNPEVFVKIYIAANGWANMAYNHVTVDEVTLYSALNYNGSADQTGPATLTGRLVEHQYNGVEISSEVKLADIEGIWMTTLTRTGGDQTGSEQLWAFSLVENELEYVGESDGVLVGCPVSLDGAEISFSYEDDSVTVTVTGDVGTDSMSGTWSDSAGDTGTWQAGKDITVEGAQTTIFEDGDILMVLDQEGGGTATFYGTVSSENGEPTFTSIICETEDGDLTITLNASEQVTELSIVDIQLTVTYNSDGTFNFDMFADGQKVYDGSNLGSASIQSLTQTSAFKGLHSGFQKEEYALPAEASEGSKDSHNLYYLSGQFTRVWHYLLLKKFEIRLKDQGRTVLDGFTSYLNEKTEYSDILRSMGTLGVLKTYRLAEIAKECNDPSVILKEACMRNYQKADKAFENYINFLSLVANAVLEQAYEDFLVEYVPNIVGTFKGTYSVYVSGCEDGTSGSFGGSMVVVIKSQSDNAFSGTFTGTLSIGIVEKGTLNGTIDNQGNVNGTTTHTAAGTAGNGTFSGTYSDDTLTITNSGRDTAGDTCSYTRQITTSR